MLALRLLVGSTAALAAGVIGFAGPAVSGKSTLSLLQATPAVVYTVSATITLGAILVVIVTCMHVAHECDREHTEKISWRTSAIAVAIASAAAVLVYLVTGIVPGDQIWPWID
jgi:hypothetical protein